MPVLCNLFISTSVWIIKRERITYGKIQASLLKCPLAKPLQKVP